MIEIPLDFSLLYGLYFGNLADELDYRPVNTTEADLGRYLDYEAAALEEAAREEGEFDLVRPWLEYLIASNNQDIRELGIEGVGKLSDIVLIHPGVGALPLDQWHHVLEYMRQKLFKLDALMIEEEKARVRRELTITTEPLAEFRKRRRAAGHLPEDPEGR